MTILDRSIQTSSRNWLLGFGAIVVAATALTLVLTGSSTDTHYSQPRVDLGNAHIPDERQHEDPETWTVIELREWLAKVCTSPLPLVLATLLTIALHFPLR